ncbi:MAG: hypothetical protein LBU73_09165 [Helicobacteraceae bacterium]|jgi:hypothetical protein|nr:hypothetical protein [Helicobacteraceae bacterium]
MEILEYLSGVKFKKDRYKPRKIQIASDRALVFGAPKAGKTALLLDKIAGENALYIDLKDDRLAGNLPAIAANLPSFCEKKSLKILVIDNYDAALIAPENLPNLERIFLAAPRRFEIAGFDTAELFLPDFEEFLSLSAKSDERAAFDEFLRSGALIETLNLDETERAKRKQEILSLIAENAPQKKHILNFFLLKSAQIFTPHQAYETLKSKYKISKDAVYSYFAETKEKRLLFSAEKFENKNAPKKYYPFDHALREAITIDRSFVKSFECAIALELIKREKTLFYSEGIDIYIPNEKRAVIAAPFAAKEHILDRVKKFAKIPIEKAEFITMNLNESFYYEANEFLVEAAPFWEWGLRQ